MEHEKEMEWLESKGRREFHYKDGGIMEHMAFHMHEYHKEMMHELVNNPQYGDFDKALPLESAHHLERWGDESHREPQHFQMVVSYITGKLIDAIWSKDSKKFEHHLITISAVCRTAHKYFKTEGTLVSGWFKDNTSKPAL